MRILGTILLFNVLLLAKGFKILVLVPYSGKSHWYVFRPILEELVKRGNDVTVVSNFPREKPLKNYHDISIAGPLTVSSHTKSMNVIGSRRPVEEMKVILNKGVEEVCRKALAHPKVQALIESNVTYDIIINEVFNTDCFLGFVYKFKAPLVGVRTASLNPWSNDRIWNPDNPSYIPNSLLGKPSRMNYFERLENFVWLWYYKILYRHYDLISTNIAREHFGKDMPELSEIAKNTSLILVNSHLAYQYAKPQVPGVKDIAGIHLEPNKTIPKELKDWIAGSTNGTVFISFGSMIRSSSISDSKRKAFFDAFSELPFRFLMKWEADNLTDVPENVMKFQWAPQYDILCHPKIKLFISHGGMLSTIEALYAGKPMIVIPAFGDQHTNAALLQEKGLAVVLQYSAITKDAVIEALKKVLYDSSYQKKAEEMSEVIRDRIVPPVEEAAYWIEYIGRHKGAPFMQISAHGMPLYQYLLLDVIGTLLILAISVVLILFIFLRQIFCFLFETWRKVNDKNGNEKKKN
ncbi:UDP-glucuronosyltransferase 2A3 [Cephus cinctus]|uniref:UDP-glucuronosyltransferase n=1 Tax=Cephus cinctus TaxID=211228 RepID=A0AAJ7C3G4_CEPCN|nr:UDP-glucuronosyltransferase 2A3 [Cephus cinctus]